MCIRDRHSTMKTNYIAVGVVFLNFLVFMTVMCIVCDPLQGRGPTPRHTGSPVTDTHETTRTKSFTVILVYM